MQSLLRSRYPSTCEPAEDPTIANIVDTARYPIHELDGTQAAAIAVPREHVDVV